jgi:hypothetical protein
MSVGVARRSGMEIGALAAVGTTCACGGFMTPDQVDSLRGSRVMTHSGRPRFWPVLLTVLYVLRCVPAAADVRIMASPGGQIGPFVDLFERVRQTGQRVVIDGPCLSACSIDARGRLRSEPQATDLVLSVYPRPVRDWIVQHGGLTSRVILLRGRELAALYPSCR